MNVEGFNCRVSKPKKSSIYEELFYTFLENNCKDKLREILTKEEGVLGQELYPLDIKYILLFNECPVLGEHLFTFPSIILKEGNKAVRRILNVMLVDLKKTNGEDFVLFPDRIGKVHVRIYSLPENCVCYEFAAKDLGRFTCLSGTVVRTTNSKLVEHSRLYKCSKCKQETEVEALPANYYVFPKTVRPCPNLCIDAKLQPVKKSKGVGLGASKLKDYQEIKIQEQRHKVNTGSIPKSIAVILEDDLTEKCKPGDDVEICGSFILRIKPFKSGQPIDAELAFLANHLQVNNDQRSSVLLTEETQKSFEDFWSTHSNDLFVGRNIILSSFCPKICGLYVVKLAMAVVLAGGVSREVNGNRIRGESHMLLVGDPGTGKSQLLKYASMLCPRSVMTTGIGTSSAGLTVSAVKDGSEWQFEPGALVLADGGVCCIDEFSCIKEQDRTSIHEAMEQQSISVAKAGMVCKLNTRCTILASTNPKGKYDHQETVAVNVALSSPLLSRFDVLLVLRDSEHTGWDDYICDFLLGGRIHQNLNPAENAWPKEKLQAYFTFIRDFEPKMTETAYQILSTYYQFQRNSHNRIASRTTVRLMESLIRLSEGHAKLMYRKEVTIHDAIIAVILIESSMQSSYMISEVDTLHCAFPEDPMEEYNSQARLVLERLDLPELWKEVDIELKKKLNTPLELQEKLEDHEELSDESESPMNKRRKIE